MLTASTLLRDAHAVLCYTMNSRGGFTPHSVQEYVEDKRYPGYLLSTEPKTTTRNEVRREEVLGPSSVVTYPSSDSSYRNQQLRAQRNLVLLINEGTASSAEVFASALHDNGRTVALIGSRTYGKGLIQHQG